jgi:hypothetical protein
MLTSSNNFGNSAGNVRKFYGDKGTLAVDNWNAPTYSADGGPKRDGKIRGKQDVEARRPSRPLPQLAPVHARAGKTPHANPSTPATNTPSPSSWRWSPTTPARRPSTTPRSARSAPPDYEKRGGHFSPPRLPAVRGNASPREASAPYRGSELIRHHRVLPLKWKIAVHRLVDRVVRALFPSTRVRRSVSPLARFTPTMPMSFSTFVRT